MCEMLVLKQVDTGLGSCPVGLIQKAMLCSSIKIMSSPFIAVLRVQLRLVGNDTVYEDKARKESSFLRTFERFHIKTPGPDQEAAGLS